MIYAKAASMSDRSSPDETTTVDMHMSAGLFVVLLLLLTFLQ